MSVCADAKKPGHEDRVPVPTLLTVQRGADTNSSTQSSALRASAQTSGSKGSRLDRSQGKYSRRGGTELNFEGCVGNSRVKGIKGHWVKKTLRPETEVQGQDRAIERQRHTDRKLQR